MISFVCGLMMRQYRYDCVNKIIRHSLIVLVCMCPLLDLIVSRLVCNGTCVTSL